MKLSRQHLFAVNLVSILPKAETDGRDFTTPTYPQVPQVPLTLLCRIYSSLLQLTPTPTKAEILLQLRSVGRRVHAREYEADDFVCGARGARWNPR